MLTVLILFEWLLCSLFLSPSKHFESWLALLWTLWNLCFKFLLADVSPTFLSEISSIFYAVFSKRSSGSFSKPSWSASWLFKVYVVPIFVAFGVFYFITSFPFVSEEVLELFLLVLNFTLGLCYISNYYSFCFLFGLVWSIDWRGALGGLTGLSTLWFKIFFFFTS